MIIRLLTLEEANAAASIYCEAFPESTSLYFGAGSSERVTRVVGALFRLLMVSGSQFLGAFCNDQLAGYCTIVTNESQFLRDLCKTVLTYRTGDTRTILANILPSEALTIGYQPRSASQK